MTIQPTLFGDEPVARRTDPQTSWDAARAVDRLKQTATQAEILAILRAYGPRTDEQIAFLAQQRGTFTSTSGFRTRRVELVRKGLVVDTGKRALTRSGRQTILWGLP